jgi:2-oxoglutarate ferredoxin oxidoreductase subunit alpha
VESFNLAEKYQCPVIIISDLLLSEHPETVEPEHFTADVPIHRGQMVSEWKGDNGTFKRYAFTKSGISPRTIPGTANTMYVAATDDHDEEGVLISDVFCNPAVRRKIAEKRMKKLDLALKDLPAPKIEGPADADVTLIGWGSMHGVIHEAVQQLNASGVRANQLHFKYLLPFHGEEATAILKKTKRTICVEMNSTGQFARHLRAETSHAVGDMILKYDGEPFEPRQIAAQVRAILAGQPRSLDVTEAEAREIAYHYVRVHLTDEVRPGKIQKAAANGQGEAIWKIEVVGRENGEKHGELSVGVETGSTYSWRPVR